MSGSAKAGTIAERHTCELRVLTGPNSARSSEARFRRIFFSLTKTYMDVGKPEMITSDTLCLTVLCEVCERKTAIFRPSNVPL